MIQNSEAVKGEVGWGDLWRKNFHFCIL